MGTIKNKFIGILRKLHLINDENPTVVFYWNGILVVSGSLLVLALLAIFWLYGWSGLQSPSVISGKRIRPAITIEEITSLRDSLGGREEKFNAVVAGTSSAPTLK